MSNRKYMGIAPECNIISVKILDSFGRGSSTNALIGLQWVLDNSTKYNIRICNLSIGTEDTGEIDPLIRAVEKLWDSGIVVVIAAGNNGADSCSVTSPGVSRKVITVGASDDHDTISIWGETLTNFSGRGPTKANICKPDFIAPGNSIISCLSPTHNVSITTSRDNSIKNSNYTTLSGTSMATPMVSGAVALLLQKYPGLYPDDVKYMLKQSAFDLKYNKNHQGWGLLDIENLFSLEGRHVR